MLLVLLLVSRAQLWYAKLRLRSVVLLHLALSVTIESKHGKVLFITLMGLLLNKLILLNHTDTIANLAPSEQSEDFTSNNQSSIINH